MPAFGAFKIVNKSSQSVSYTVAPIHWCDAPGYSTGTIPPGGISINLGMLKSSYGGADGEQGQFYVTLSRPPITYDAMVISFDSNAQPFTQSEVPFLSRLHFVKDAWHWDTDVDATLGEPAAIKTGKLVLINKSNKELSYSVTPDYGCDLPKPNTKKQKIKPGGQSAPVSMKKAISGGANAVFSVNLSLETRGESTNYKPMKVSFNNDAAPYTLAEVPYLSEIHKLDGIWYWEFDIDQKLPEINF